MLVVIGFPRHHDVATSLFSAISSENVWSAVVRVGQCLLQKPLGGFVIPRFRQIEVHRLAPVAIDRPEQVHPLASDPNEGSSMCQVETISAHLPVQPPVDLQAVSLSPAPNRRVIDGKTPRFPP
jgi:hypothetical protein